MKKQRKGAGEKEEEEEEEVLLYQQIRGRNGWIPLAGLLSHIPELGTHLREICEIRKAEYRVIYHGDTGPFILGFSMLGSSFVVFKVGATTFKNYRRHSGNKGQFKEEEAEEEERRTKGGRGRGGGMRKKVWRRKK